jgi:hypothetical protein
MLGNGSTGKAYGNHKDGKRFVFWVSNTGNSETSRGGNLLGVANLIKRFLIETNK